MSDLNKQVMIDIFQDADNGQGFPIPFELAWVWVGYSRKAKAKEKLTRNFTEGFDFQASHRMVQKTTEQGLQASAGRPYEYIELSLDCFKQFCMMAGTAKGREVREYFIKVEREYRALAKAVKVEPIVSPLSALPK